MKLFVLIFCATMLLAGCGSSVKLDNVAVEDKTGTPISQLATNRSGEVVGKSGVTSLDIGTPEKQGLIPPSKHVIYFDYDSFIIKPEFQPIIESNARLLNADKASSIAIEGHTDERGGREYNLALGQKRAEAVRNALGLLGVADSQAEAISFGKEKPAVQGSNEDAMTKNRRVEISYR